MFTKIAEWNFSSDNNGNNVFFVLSMDEDGNKCVVQEFRDKTTNEVVFADLIADSQDFE